MRSKQRILSVLRGKEVDRIPWSPNLAYWWEAQSENFTACGEVEFLKSIGADPLIRGHYPYYGKEWRDIILYRTEYKSCSIKEFKESSSKTIVYETPIGNISAVYRYSPSGNTWYLAEHPVKEEKGFKILAYLFEDMVIRPDYELYNEAAKKWGDDALLVPIVAPSPNLKTSFQSLLEYWVGTEELVYALADYPEIVEETLESMRKVSLKTAEISAQSDAEAFTSWEDTSTTNISPDLYERYILPEINDWCRILHSYGKLYIQHACGHLKALIPLMAKSDIDCIESISPPPTGNIELWEARKILPERIALIGGIEPTVFLESDIDKLESYVTELLEKLKGTRYILANSDSCPPGISLEKFNLVSKIVKEFNK